MSRIEISFQNPYFYDSIDSIMKKFKIPFLYLTVSLMTLCATVEAKPPHCTILYVSGLPDAECTTKPNLTRCFANVKYDDGLVSRIWSGTYGTPLACVPSPAQCAQAVTPSCSLAPSK